MINSAKEAREILYRENFDPDERTFASGYLAALQGPEVKALVEALEKLKLQHFGRVQGTIHILGMTEQEVISVEDADKALAQYLEAVKP